MRAGLGDASEGREGSSGRAPVGVTLRGVMAECVGQRGPLRIREHERGQHRSGSGMGDVRILRVRGALMARTSLGLRV